MYFVSDMFGGKGGLDIYRVNIDVNGNFSVFERFLDNINIEGKENFLYLDSIGNLYFFSDGY